MTTDTSDRTAFQRRFWDDIEKNQIGMLGLSDQPQSLQPMTAFVERDTGELWFFTRDDTDLATEIESGARPALFTYQSKDIYACVRGDLSLRNDPARMDRYWNAVVAAWYPEGRDDPHLRLACMRLHEADVWISEAGPVRFAWEIAKANATSQQPDLGGRAHLDFH